MPNSPYSYNVSASCRTDWRPSAVLCGALIALGLLAGLSLLASDLPDGLAWPMAAASPAWGAWLARREWRRSPRSLAWRTDGTMFVDGERVDAAELHWRGPLAFLSWRAGNRIRRLVWWPDTLTAAQRRELRLAAGAAEAAHSRARMAP